MSPSNAKHILIHCTFNIGDVLLTLPLAGILKQHFLQAKISFLGRDYTRDMAIQSVHVDAFYSWDDFARMTPSDAIAAIKAQAFDVVIHESPDKAVATLMRRARVPIRIGTSHRLYHWFTCNKWVNLSRKKSPLHEAQTSLKLLAPFRIPINNDLMHLHQQMGLKKPASLSSRLHSFLKPDRFNLIVHPFSNKHTLEWPPALFNALIQQLPQDNIHVIVTGSKKESMEIQEKIMPGCTGVTNLSGQLTLQELISFIAHADGLVTNGTGPLHIAAAYGIHALGLYPASTVTRWHPIGEKAAVIASDSSERMESITVNQVKTAILSMIGG